MKELKSKIVTLKLVKLSFYFMFFAGLIIFVFMTGSSYFNIERNLGVSTVLMGFGLIAVEICNYQINALTRKFKALKAKRINKTTKIIEFNKIA